MSSNTGILLTKKPDFTKVSILNFYRSILSPWKNLHCAVQGLLSLKQRWLSRTFCVNAHQAEMLNFAIIMSEVRQFGLAVEGERGLKKYFCVCVCVTDGEGGMACRVAKEWIRVDVYPLFYRLTFLYFPPPSPHPHQDPHFLTKGHKHRHFPVCR
jgi:hypothetical protein